MQDFLKDEAVEFELSPNDPNEPRWNADQDRGSSGKFAKGTVLGAGKDTIEVMWLGTVGQPCTWLWYQPSVATHLYREPGYLRRVVKPAPKCDCGAVKAKTTHSHWCSTVEGK